MVATVAEATAFAPLLTERLQLRPFVAADAPELFRLINDFEVARQLARVPFPYPREAADEWISAAERSLADGSAFRLVIAGREEPLVLGGIGLELSSSGREAELGYWVARRYWGHGVASEAAGRMTRWALANLDIERVVARVALDNAASRRVLEKLGFVFAGEGEGYSMARGETRPVRLFAASRAPLRAPVLPDPTASRVLVVAAAALIDADTRVLLARRPEGKALAGLWEFPGGKVQGGETPEAALIRELKEELGIDVSAACLAPFTFASHAYPDFHLLMPLYLCRRWHGRPKGLEGQSLAWVPPLKLADYNVPPADRPLLAMLRDFL